MIEIFKTISYKTSIKYIFIFLLGVSYILSFAPFYLYPVSFLSIGGLAYLLFDASQTRIFVYRLSFYFLGLFTAGASWIFVSIYFYNKSTLILAIFCTFLFILALTLISTLSLFAWKFLLKKYLSDSNMILINLSFASFWTLGEIIRLNILSGFPFLIAGDAQVNNYLAGFGIIGGHFLISFIVAAIASTLAYIIYFHYVKKQAFNKKLIIAQAIICLSFFIIGKLLLSIKWTTESQEIKLAILQPNVQQVDKWEADKTKLIINNLIDQIKDADKKQNLDLILSPETAIPTLYSFGKDYINTRLASLNLNPNTQVLTGVVYDEDFDNEVIYNSIIDLQNEDIRFNKYHLLDFAETLPAVNLFKPLLKMLNFPANFFTLGDFKQKNFMINSIEALPAICYEMAFGHEISQRTENSQFLITVSNDAWFTNTIAPYLQIQVAQMRAIENQKPVIRSANTGISAIIDKNGDFIEKTEQNQKVTIYANLKTYKGKTPYNFFGDYLIYSILLLILILIISSSYLQKITLPKPKQ